MRRGVIIHNPASGLGDVHRELVRARDCLIERGWSIDIQPTGRAGDAGRLARAAADAGLDAALIAGGDGTLNEAVNALVGTDTALGLLPCGTANVWARQLGMPVAPRKLVDAAKRMDEARVRTIDVGCVALAQGTDREMQRYFLLWSGLGLDAYITRAIEPRPAAFKRWGVVGYGLAALRAAATYRGLQVVLEVDGRRMAERVLLVVVSNVELYAGYFHLASSARIDDGWLDVSLFRGQGFLASIGHFARVLLHRHVRDPRLVTMRARHVRVTSPVPCDIHVDAEPIGQLPAEYTIRPRALRILAPRGAPDALFTREPESDERTRAQDAASEATLCPDQLSVDARPGNACQPIGGVL